MPVSILLQGWSLDNEPLSQVQGATVQGMFMNLMGEVDSAVSRRLHDDSRYRPYTLSPLGIGQPDITFQRFHLPNQSRIQTDRPYYVRITLLEDPLFSTFDGYFRSRSEPTFEMGDTHFRVTNVLCTQANRTRRSDSPSYADLIAHADTRYRTIPLGDQRKIALRFLTPTSFRRGNVDFPMPDPRLVFSSYRKRFEDFAQIAFLPDFDEQVEFYTGISRLHRLETATIRTKKVSLIGFVGGVTYLIDKKAPPDLVFQMNLLADYAFFCGTGRKTTMGMGQTVRST